MQSWNDRRRLMNQMYREPAHPMATLAKCGAGLAIVTLLVTLDLDPGVPDSVQRTDVRAVSSNPDREGVRAAVPATNGDEDFRRVDRARSARDRAARITAPLAP
jgi:hypothetical protein